MFNLKVAAMVLTILTPVSSLAGAALIWKAQKDTQIEQLINQQKDMQQDIKWLIRHQPDGDNYLRNRPKASYNQDDELNMLNKPSQTAGDPNTRHY